jgi:spermidine synthase
MTQFTRRILFLLFFLSGFCGLLYQVIWTRMAFASFGIIIPVLSVVLSIFMLGLSIGAWAGGQLIGPLQKKSGLSAIFFYGLLELFIGAGAFAVPKLFGLGEEILLSAGQTDSFHYLLFSAVALGLSIFPWCVCMGATFPFMMAFVRTQDPRSVDSFSYLYLANVLGAMSGTFLTAIVLVEVLGFRHTLFVAAFANFSIALISAALAWRHRRAIQPALFEVGISAPPLMKSKPSVSHRRLIKLILFSTGFCAMAMEVVWARAFTPVLRTQVYSFAMILFAYLGATFLGSALYRRDLRHNRVRPLAELTSVLAVAAFLPIVLNDVRFLLAVATFLPIVLAKYAASAIIVLSSICPLCMGLGYLTPSLIDEGALGDPAGAGKAYAVNVLGCILGPMFASYVLLPCLGERYGLILLALPFLVFYFFISKSLSTSCRFGVGLISVVLVFWSMFYAVDFAGLVSRKAKGFEVRRDYAASVISAGEGRGKSLLVNGVGMTSLIPATKFMAHLPLVLHTGKPESVLIICFGMGTTFRSALSWNVETTAVELVPSVKDAFEFYHADAARVLRNPKGRIIIDDGRRYLKRTREKFDVIVIDPPPPPAAAGSSLLYSTEFYELAKQHLKPNGILQTYLPRAESATEQAVLRSLRDSFPHVQCFGSLGDVGTHMLASMEPIVMFASESLAHSMPTDAAEDLLEWSASRDLSAYLQQVLSKPVPVKEMLSPDPKIRISDDHPYNEYFLLRRLRLF